MQLKLTVQIQLLSQRYLFSDRWCTHATNCHGNARFFAHRENQV